MRQFAQIRTRNDNRTRRNRGTVTAYTMENPQKKWEQLSRAFDEETARINRRAWRRFLVVLAAWSLLTVLVIVALSGCTVSQPVSACGPVTGTKRGTSASVQVLGMTVKDGGTIREAAFNGQVSNVQAVDVRHTNLLGIYRRSLTVVTGD